MMFKFITMQEVLIPVLQQSGGEKSYVSMDKITANNSIIQYFQNVRSEPVWDYEDFEVFFEAHFDIFDAKMKDDGVLYVKLRSKSERLATR